MRQRPPQRELTERDRAILRDVIGTFILTGEPVSSRTVSRLERHGLSAASIRNVMADLEDLGFLTHPHTSAGRVPTGEGYHLYIESLMPNRKVTAKQRRYIEESLSERVVEGEMLMSSASNVLSELSNKIGIVVTPAVGETLVKAINFLKLSGRKVLCVVVSESGFVDTKVIETAERLPRRELIRISNYLTDNFCGLAVREIRQRLVQLMGEERAKVDRLLANAVTMARSALEQGGTQEVFVEGTASLLSLPELADLDRVQRLLETFTDKASLVSILTSLVDGPGVRVVIGEDSDLTSGLEFSLVGTTYGIGEKPLGALGVFGPSRMDYEMMIPLVDFLGERLSRALEMASGGGLEH